MIISESLQKHIVNKAVDQAIEHNIISLSQKSDYNRISKLSILEIKSPTLSNFNWSFAVAVDGLGLFKVSVDFNELTLRAS